MPMEIKKAVRLLTLVSVTLLGACAGAGQTAGGFVDDSVITTKVKSKLLDDPITRTFQIHVTTIQGTVQLDGVVTGEKEKLRAEENARDIPGVKKVENNLSVK